MILPLLLGLSSSAFADCKTDCRAVIASSDKLISDLKAEINLDRQLQAAQNTQIVSLTLQNDEKANALASAFRNPFIIGGIGISIGAIAVLLIKAKR